MIAILARASGDLLLPDVLRVMGRSLAVTLLLFVLLGAGLAWAMAEGDVCTLLGLGACQLGSAGGMAVSVPVTLAACWLLFPVVAVGVVAAYSDRIVAAVERRHYLRAFHEARRPGAGTLAWLALRSGVRLLACNLIALPVYLLLAITGIGTAIAVVLVNGFAMGRDFGEMVAIRHGDAPARRAWLRASRGPRLAIGCIASALFLVPVANLLAPVLGAAMATHLFHRRPDALRS